MAESYSVSAPGSAMIMGEHAVLEGYPAIVAAVDYRITATLTPRSDRRVVIYSQLGEHSQSLDYLMKQPPFEGVIACCQLLQDSLTGGFDLTIDSQMSHQVGLGSSAAVIVATLAVLQQWLNGALDRDQLFTWAQQAMAQQQGLGSGADLAASIYGGILAYQKQPLYFEQLPLPLSVCEDKEQELNVMNSGTGSRTPSETTARTSLSFTRFRDDGVDDATVAKPVTSGVGDSHNTVSVGDSVNNCDRHQDSVTGTQLSDRHFATKDAVNQAIDSPVKQQNDDWLTSFPDSPSSFPRRRESSQSNNSDSHRVSELETGTKDTINQTIDSPVEQQNDEHSTSFPRRRESSAIKDSMTVTAFQFGLLYCGHKRPTAQVIQWLQQQFSDQPDDLQAYYQKIGETVPLAIDAWQRQDWSAVCQQVEMNQRCMEQLGLCHEPLAELKQLCDTDPYIAAAKVSGSGLGDCLLGIGDWSQSELREHASYIPMPIAREGVVCH